MTHSFCAAAVSCDIHWVCMSFVVSSVQQDFDRTLIYSVSHTHAFRVQVLLLKGVLSATNVVVFSPLSATALRAAPFKHDRG